MFQQPCHSDFLLRHKDQRDKSQSRKIRLRRAVPPRKSSRPLECLQKICDVQEPSERSPAILAVPRLNLLCSYAIAARLGRPVPTIDLRVDYHKAAMPGDITAKARVLRMGGQFSTAEAYLYDTEGALVASGRGTYLTAPPKQS